MTDMPPPYPGINSPYVSGGAPQGQGAWGGQPPQQNGTPGWANPNYNPQANHAGAYPGYQPNYNNYPQIPPPYSAYPQPGSYAQGPYNQYPPHY